MLRKSNSQLGLALLVGALLLYAQSADAHCDTLDGPVITDAKKALAKKDFSPILKWIRPQDEAEIEKAFAETLEVRTQSKAARELADKYFFETLVRIHRAGEGAPYTGLKPSSSTAHIELAADKALEAGSLEKIVEHLTNAAKKQIKARFEKAVAAKTEAQKSPEAGRKYVRAYVEFLHYVSGLSNAISAAGEHHHEE